MFKVCALCKTSWATRDAFLTDPGIVSLGYQANFVSLEKGLFLFNHSCHGTLAIEVHLFADLYDGPVYDTRLTGSDSCLGYCLQRKNLRPCTEKCECAYVREILQLLKDSPG
ncbi:MAG: hypothetical protein IMY82_06420 [Chloroflexi bacterium]|nr:hypothetical protein [Chloroflexota bacterium]